MLVNDTDIDGDPLTATLVTGPANGQLTLSPDGSFTYTPNANYNGSDSFTYTANDGALDSATVNVSLTVTPVNDAPSVTSATAANFAENGTGVAYQATGTDPDAGTTLTWSLGGADAALFSIDGAGAVRFKTAPNFEAPTDVGGNNVYDITVTCSDGTLSSAARDVAITVTDVIEAVKRIGGTGADSLTGGEGDDSLYGGAGNDTLISGSGNDIVDGGLDADSLVGGTGNDVYVVDNVLDDVVENAAEGTDVVRTTLSSYVLGANIENLRFIGTGDFDGTGNGDNNFMLGGTGNDTLSGGEGNDWINGGAGADSMVGGTGNDGYTVDDPSDVVIENASEGTDMVRTTLSSYTLGANWKNLSFGGTGDFDGTGNDLNNYMEGGAGNDTLSGGEGNDWINGGAGADSMVGGTGNDVYVVDDVLDDVVENAADGTDVVRTTLLSYALGANVENIRFVGTGDFGGSGNDLNNYMEGGAGNDTLSGGEGNDWINGGAGADSMVGGTGNDGYTVDDPSDVVIENASEGTDMVRTTLSSYTLGAILENSSFGGTGDFDGTGNDLNNYMQGGAGNDILSGGNGNDVLVGGLGNDIFCFGSAAEGGDTIRDYVAADDTVQVSAVGFGGGLTAGVNCWRRGNTQRTSRERTFWAPVSDSSSSRPMPCASGGTQMERAALRAFC